ncbi:MAG: hypothetical protein RLZZ187_693 [Pseudomonadota bacterium]|jgi:hypothetical protein
MPSGVPDLLAILAGVLLALLLVGLLALGMRLVRAGLRLFRRGQGQSVPRRLALRARRLGRARALARAEGARAAALAEEVQRLRVELRLLRAKGGAADDRFLRAKREFARRFHPDRLPRSAPDRALRTGIFREFWAVLKRIERGR